MKERRTSPRTRFSAKKTGFSVTLVMKRFFLRDKAITCVLRDISEGGASLLVNDEYKKYVTERSVGNGVRLLSENPEISFRLHRKGRVLRVLNNEEGVTAVVIFTHQPEQEVYKKIVDNGRY
ncbi:MAG: PilZ domain-containing protein [Spirochaetes bacterium]|nr:PilZ domain-containing protein [Spirochaetota bacterium]